MTEQSESSTPMPFPPFTIIVAATRTNGIGLSSTNALPWRLPKEMAYFARVTTHAPEGRMNAVVMGRKTWDSIPERFRPLKGRWNVVLSRRAMTELDGAPNMTRLSQLDDLPSAKPPLPLHRVFVIGGASIYQSAMSHPSLQRILLTRVLDPEYTQCDVHFPEIRTSKQIDGGGDGSEDESEWRQSSHEELKAWVGGPVPDGVQEEKGTKYEFQMWLRRGSSDPTS